MRQQLYIALLAVGLLNCTAYKDSIYKTKLIMKLVFEIIPEDYDQNLYYVEWQDIIEKRKVHKSKNGDQKLKEIWCTITNNSNDTLGYYKGLSTNQTFAYFQTTDTIVILNFMIGLNKFSNKFNDKKLEEKYWEANRNSVVFEPICINIKSDLRKKFEVELKLKEK